MNSLLLDEAIKETLFESKSTCSWQSSTRKNRQRFALGQIYPLASSIRRPGNTSPAMAAECFLRAATEQPLLKVNLRFLQPIARVVGSFSARSNEIGGGLAQSFQPMHEFTVEGRRFHAGQESVQREVNPPTMTLDTRAASQASFPFRFYASREFEPIRDSKQQIAGAIFRWQEGLTGAVEMQSEPAGSQSFRLTLRLLNRTPLDEADAEDHDAILLRTFISAHVVIRAVGGEFVVAAGPERN